MKKTTFILLIILLTVAFGFGQSYQYQPWTPAMGELDFMTLGDAAHPYVQTKYSNNYTSPSTIGIQGSGTSSSHRLITVQSDDPCRCYQATPNSPYIHEKYLPLNWADTIGNVLNADDYLDAVIQIGCGTSSNTCNKAAQIEYWFYPQPDESTLLIKFSFAIQDISSTHGVEMGCGSIRQPQFWIEIFDGETGQLLNTGYYPTKASAMTNNPVPNTNWPYSRFLAWPSGCSSGSDSQNPADDYGITTYYWAGQNANGYATPTTFTFRDCPSNQTGGNSSQPVKWFEYKPLAFNLSAQAKMNVDQNGNPINAKSVKLRIRTAGCSATAHWAYGLYAAKMIPGQIKVDACGGDDIHFSVPAGFIPDTYEWHYGYDSADAKNKIWDLSTPMPGIHVESYDVFLNRDTARIWPYYRCEIKSYTGVPFIYEAHVKSYYIEPNLTFVQNFNNCDLSATLIDSSRVYTVIPPTYQGGSEDTVHQETQFINWYVKRYNNFIPIGTNITTIENFTFDSTTISPNGLATLKIVVQDEERKCIDSIEKDIVLDISSIGKVYSVDTVVTCEEKLPYLFDQAYFGDTQSWSTEGTRRVNYQGLAWNGCDSLVDVTLIVRKPTVEVVFDLDYCDEFRTTLTAASNDHVSEYNWSTGENTPSITITAPGTYSVSILNEEGCAASNSITIPACKPFLNLPNTITPSNVDGLNDYFYIPQRNLIQSLEFTVFNRNGEVVYHTTNKDFEWNGSENGRIYPGSTYSYTLKITDYEGVSSSHKGSITIL